MERLFEFVFRKIREELSKISNKLIYEIIGGIIAIIFMASFFEPIIDFLFKPVIVPIGLMIIIFIYFIAFTIYFLRPFASYNSLKKFNELKINEIVYHWKYIENGKQISISNISALCPICKIELSLNKAGSYRCRTQTCPNFETQYNFGHPPSNDQIKKRIVGEIVKNFPDFKDRLMNTGII